MKIDVFRLHRLHRLHRLCLLALILFFVVTGPGTAGAGLKVSPGAFCLQNAKIGENLDLGIDMVITNKDDEEKVFVIKILKPSEADDEWVKGYSEIPDVNWFYLDENEIKIGPNSEAKLGMYLKIPDEEKYCNQHWMVYAKVTTKAEKEEMFKTAIKPCYMIETKAKADIKEKPYGVLGLVPGTLEVRDVAPGKKKKVTFRIYNNDSVIHTYGIASYIPGLSSAKLDINLTAGYEWIKKERWVSPVERKIKLKPGEIKDITLKVVIPKGSKCADEGWESIVMVKPDKGLEGFVRVLIEPSE